MGQQLPEQGRGIKDLTEAYVGLFGKERAVDGKWATATSYTGNDVANNEIKQGGVCLFSSFVKCDSEKMA
ncbi:hypothetical protein L1887_23047 [Cichorium endivia]|nr:hypothetical protein L1887_23047 [Cichorium endivia]